MCCSDKLLVGVDRCKTKDVNLWHKVFHTTSNCATGIRKWNLKFHSLFANYLNSNQDLCGILSWLHRNFNPQSIIVVFIAN